MDYDKLYKFCREQYSKLKQNKIVNCLDESEINFIKKKIYYLNIQELENIAKKFNIPIHIFEQKDNQIIETNIREVKINIIKNILRLIIGKKLKQTIIPQNVINKSPIKNLNEYSKVYYGQFKSNNKQILNLMKQLTNNKYKNGAIAFIILRNLWSKGKLINYKEFAKLWLKENEKHDKPNIEWAYLTDLNQGTNLDDWKNYRRKISKKIIKLLN